jgi:iron complex outermembrane recepter protein
MVRGSVALFAGIAGAALAQPPEGDVRVLNRIVVTGSNIPRSDSESALPVRILTQDEILRSGASTLPELMSKVAANSLGFNDQLAVGNSVRPGLSSANLRGIGDGSTLVLLNGRRVANYAFDGGTVDLSTIPLSAIERLEILKDGASAIYGSDAIAGVINVVLRKDFRGVEATVSGAWTTHGGADQRQASMSAGYGALSTDRFNVFATLDYRKEEALRALDRPFSRSGYIPAEGINLLSGTSFPANILIGPRLLVNPAFATGCTPPISIPVTIPLLSLAPMCGYDFTGGIDLIAQSERMGAIGRATFRLDADHQWFAEANYAQNRFLFRNSPTAVFQGALSSTQPVLYPAAGPYYPSAFAAANGISGDLNVRFRTLPLGPQTNATDTRASRVAAGAEGHVGGWAYGTGLVWSENRQTDSFVSGYVSQQRLIPALASGIINPFGASAAEGDALLASTQIVGTAHRGKGVTLALDAKASKEIHILPTGPLAIALGAEARREKLQNLYMPAWTSGDVLGVGGDQQSVSGSRSAAAMFAEAVVPIARGLEAQIAVRHDHYSDFGGTTNPKVALRWQPARPLLLRTSWGTGFRAPTLYDLFTPLSRSAVFGASLHDPIRCPITRLPIDCDGVFASASGGNEALKPETSGQFGAGLIWQPIADISLTVDYWRINKRGVIGSLNPAVVFGQFTRYAPTNIIRGTADPAFPDLPGPIETVLLTQQNLGGLRTSGIDFDIQWHGPSTPVGNFDMRLEGAYLLTWQQQLDGTTYTSALGRKGFGIAGPVPRWKHYAMFRWQIGPWNTTLAQAYQRGYDDANMDRFGVPLAIPPRRVGSHEIWDLQILYGGLRNITLALGVKNLMDRAPPFSNQPFSRQVGFDPVYADPRGRTLHGRVTLAFK